MKSFKNLIVVAIAFFAISFGNDLVGQSYVSSQEAIAILKSEVKALKQSPNVLEGTAVVDAQQTSTYIALRAMYARKLVLASYNMSVSQAIDYVVAKMDIPNEPKFASSEVSIQAVIQDVNNLLLN